MSRMRITVPMNIISELERDLLDFNYTNKHGGKNSMNVNVSMISSL